MIRRFIVGLLGAISFWFPAAAAQVTVTFDALPDWSEHDPYHENGVTATGAGLGYYASRGTMHLDDSGSIWANFVVFSAPPRFDFISLDVVGSRIVYFREFIGDDDHPPYEEEVAYDNVLLEGFRDGVKTGSQLLSTGLNSKQFTISDLDGFDGLTALKVSARYPQFIGERDGFVYDCADNPCGHFSIDNLTLDIVPLPPALPMFIAAVGSLLFLGYWRTPGRRSGHLG